MVNYKKIAKDVGMMLSAVAFYFVLFGSITFGPAALGQMEKNRNEPQKSRNKLEKLADLNGDGIINTEEKCDMYEMCGVNNKPSTYILTYEDIQKGIEAYNKN